MKDIFSDFIESPNKENFMELREMVINHPDFNPVSKDIEELEKLMDAEKYDEVVNYNSINVLLDAQAYFIKSDAHKKKQEITESGAAEFIAKNILKGILETGDGTISSPYQIIRVDDEYMLLLLYLGEQVASQELVNKKEKVFDRIETVSKKIFYFEITHCFNYNDPMILEIMNEMETENSKPQWWRIW